MATLPSYRTWVAGEIVTAAYLNANIRDNGNFMIAEPMCRLRNVAGQSIANAAFTSITWDTEDIDSDNGHSTVTNPVRYTAQTAGWYQLSGCVGFQPGATGQRGGKYLKNGTDFPGAAAIVGATGSLDNCTPMRVVGLSLIVGDYIEIQAYQSNGGALTTSTTTQYQPSFDVRWVRTP